MFSEYASKFLAQSQSTLSVGGQRDFATNRITSDRHRPPSRSRGGPSAFMQRRNMLNPYQPSASQSRFPFASRTSNAQAPLFYSATDFREEDDVEEHDRDLADQYALQRSRRQFGGSHLTESSEIEDDVVRGSDHSVEGNSEENGQPRFGMGTGIKSSWKGDQYTSRGRPNIPGPVAGAEERERSLPSSERSGPSSKGKEKLVDVELSTVRSSSEELDEDEELLKELEGKDGRPASFQHFRDTDRKPQPKRPMRNPLPIPRETDEETLLEHPRPMSPDRESLPQTVAMDPSSPPRHNFFWAELFLIAQCAVFGVYFVALLQTNTPDKKQPLGDTIYTVLHSSFHLLGVYSLVSIIVGLLWLSMLRSFVRPLVFLILVAVPVILFSFFLYPLISSYKGTWHGNSVQDKVMRWFSIVPAICAMVWVYTVWRGRHSLTKAAELLEFSSRILTQMSPLLLVGFATLAGVVLWSWIWMLMFTRLFLEGHFSKSRFIIDFTTWWLGVAFVVDYLWTLGVISGIQRAATAATVSQWYFHRNTIPSPSSRAVVQASVIHATTTMSGTICFSTFTSLAVRLPLLLLPRRFGAFLTMCAYSLIPTPIATLTNPLTLTYASVHGQPLGTAARNLSQLSFVSKTSPTTTLSPRSFSSPGGSSLLPYRLAKLLLHATRFVMSLALGFGGWVSTARMIEVGTSGYKGSLYAYVVGLIAAAIGWGALGAMEGVLGGILDAVVVCWASEVGNGHNEVRYCREAGELFGDGRPSRRYS